MDDINFDELDQAVNSVMQPEGTHVSSSDDVTQTSPVSQTVSKPASPVASASALPTKRRGQFMDMVHPSSDMRTSIAPASPVRRQAASIAPLNPSLVETSIDAPVISTGVTSSLTNDALLPEPPKNDHEWPDPIDMAQSDVQPAEVSDADMATVENSFVNAGVDDTPQLEDEARVEPSIPEADPVVEVDVPQSPFVEGAAVEKRPLGAFAIHDENSNEPLTEEDQTKPISDGMDTLESATASEANNEPLAVSEDVPEHAAVADEEITSDELVTSVETITPTELTEPADTTVGAVEVGTAQSIPQQYRPEEMTRTDDEEHAVFDTAQYHQPLALPEKQHSAHKTVFYLFLAVLMLAIGAAAGYAIFILKLF